MVPFSISLLLFFAHSLLILEQTQTKMAPHAYLNSFIEILICTYNYVQVSQIVSVPSCMSLSVLLLSTGQTADTEKVVLTVVKFIRDIAWYI